LTLRMKKDCKSREIQYMGRDTCRGPPC
jgi:hypothetical protein